MTCPCRWTCSFYRSSEYTCTHEPSKDPKSSLYCKHYVELTGK
jgi:hypothetical protein